MSFLFLKEPEKLLEVPLMCRSSERPPMLDINFNRLAPYVL